jgi:hypothetical protein
LEEMSVGGSGTSTARIGEESMREDWVVESLAARVSTCAAVLSFI